jgi:hypothetical protein
VNNDFVVSDAIEDRIGVGSSDSPAHAAARCFRADLGVLKKQMDDLLNPHADVARAPRISMLDIFEYPDQLLCGRLREA